MKKKITYLFTQETISDGHPDKIVDSVTDAILDEYLRYDKTVKLGCEGMAMENLFILGGESKSDSKIDIEKVVRKTIVDIGYDKDEYGFNGHTLKIMNKMTEQSPEINKMVVNDGKDFGANDQGIAYGTSSNESRDFVTLPYYLARVFCYCVKNSGYDYIRPDVKTQVSVEYNEEHKPVRVHTVVISTSHSKDITLEDLRKNILNDIVKPRIERLDPRIKDLFDDGTIYKINEYGTFTIFGPKSDCGISGRKLACDNAFPLLGGGNMSGKCYFKNDRYGPYYARYISKNMVAAGVADQITIQLSYVIGDTDVTSVNVSTRGNHTKLSDIEIGEKIRELFSFKPKDIIEKLKLDNPIYLETSKWGHFGHDSYIKDNVEFFPWEKLDQVNYIKTEFDIDRKIQELDPDIHV